MGSGSSVASSTIVRHLITRPSAVLEYEIHRPDLVGLLRAVPKGWRSDTGTFLRQRRRTLKASFGIEPFDTLVIDLLAGLSTDFR